MKNIWKQKGRAKARWWLNMYKLSHGCKHCDDEFEVQKLDVHHVKPEKKTIRPTLMPNREWSISRMLTELKHCIILCRDCHMKEHFIPSFGKSGIFVD